MQKRLVTPADLNKYQWISDPSVSVNGLVAFVHKTIDEDQNGYKTSIRVINLETGEPKFRLNGEKDMSPLWSHDGRHLAFLRIEDGKKQLWMVNEEGDEPQKLTDTARGIDNFLWSPNGKDILFSAKVLADEEAQALSLGDVHPNEKGRVFERTAFKAEGRGLWNGRYTHLFLLSMEDKSIQKLTHGPFDVSSPVWSPDGTQLAFLTKIIQDPSKDSDLIPFQDIYTMDLCHRELVKITDTSLSISDFHYSYDGESFYLIGNDRQYGSGTQNRLYKMDVNGGKPEYLLKELDIQIGNFALSDMKSSKSSPAFAHRPTDKEIYALGTFHGNVHVYCFLPDGTYDQITSGERDIHQMTISSDGRYLIVVSSDSTHPTELYRIDLHTKEEVKLTNENGGLMDTLEISIPEEVWFESSDGFKVQGWMMKPTNIHPGEQVPLILQIHGGPHAMYSSSYSHEFQSLVSKGYAILFTNPRGSFGYGQRFAKACRGDFGGGDYQDLMNAVDYALEHFDFINQKRIGVAGGSYGGLMTNWIVSHSSRFQAAVTQRCISNWLSFYGTSDIGISYTEGIVGGNPWDHQDLLLEKSPLSYVNNIKTPLFIIHGEQDLRCPVSQSDELYVALRRLKKKTKLIRYPNANHSLLKSGKPSLRIDLLEQVNSWFNKYLKTGG